MLALRLFERAKAFLTRAGTVILATSLVVWALAWFPRSHATEQRFEQERAALVATHSADAADTNAQSSKLAEIDAREAAEHLEQSALGRTGRAIEPLFRPLGWDWRVTMAALAAFPAREIVVSTLGPVFRPGR